MKRLLKHLICVFFLIFAAAPASAFQKENITINVDGKQRSIVLFTPNNVGSGLPVMIVTHGMNQNTTYQLEGDHFSELVDSERFILAYLESDGGTWDIGGSKDLNFVDATVNYLDNRFHVDRNRLYWSGFSMGSMLIYHAIRSEIGKKFAAFAPCSGILFTAEPWNQRTTPVNLIHCHAKPDDVFNYNNYNIHGYVEHFATLDKAYTYKKVTDYQPNPSELGYVFADKETWTNGTNGSEVELISAYQGGHWPTIAYKYEIWNFCKRFSLNGAAAPQNTIANFNPDPVTGRYVASFNDFVTGGDLQFDRNSGQVTLPAGKTGTLSITFNGADFSDVTQVRLSCDGGDVFDILSVNKTDGSKVNGGDFWSSKYLLNFDGYQSEGNSIASLVWAGTNNTSETKTMNIRQLLVQVDVMCAGKKHEQEIDRWAFGIWDGTGAGTTRQGNDDAMAYNIGQCIAGYGTIYGNNSVLALNYADLTRYSKLRVYGDNGVHIRALFNRPTDTSSDFVLKEGDITDGVFEIDLRSVGSYAHLNALKVGGGTGAAWRVMVVDDNDVMDYHLYGKQYVEANLAEALSDQDATNYDATALKNPSAVALNTANKNALIYVDNAARLSNAANVVVKNGNDYSASNIVLTDGESDAANVADAYLAGGTTENCTWSESNGNWTFEWGANTSSAWVEIMHWVNITESQKGTQYKYLMVDTEEFTEKWGVSFLDGDGNTLVTQGYWNPMSAGASTTKIIDIDALFAAANRSGDRSKLTKIRLFNVETTNAGKVVVKRAYLYNEAGDCVYPFFAPYDIAAQNATLNTVVPQGGFTTLTIPFVASLPGGYTSHALLADNVLQFDWVDANRPIVLQGQAGAVSLTASNTTVKATDGLEAGVLKGTYRTTSVAAGNYVQGASGADSFSPVEGLQFAAVASGAEPTLLPFRAYATAKVVTTEPQNPEPENPEPDDPVTPDPVEPNPTAEPFTLTVSSAGVATLYLGFDAVIPTDVEFFAVAGVTDLQGSVAYLKEVKGGIIPANTGLMIFANPGKYTLVPSTVAATEKVESKLHGVLVDTPIETVKANEPGFNIFVLSRGVTELTGFKPAGSTIKSMTANKAYFPMPADSEVKMVTFSFGGNMVTGIEDIKAALTSPASNDIFDLSGRRVSNPTKGIYIINGKKVLIK